SAGGRVDQPAGSAARVGERRDRGRRAGAGGGFARRVPGGAAGFLHLLQSGFRQRRGRLREGGGGGGRGRVADAGHAAGGVRRGGGGVREARRAHGVH